MITDVDIFEKLKLGYTIMIITCKNVMKIINEIENNLSF